MWYDDDCYAPGWEDGPLTSGGEPDGCQCERRAGHDGPHGAFALVPKVDGFDNPGDYDVTWPVTEGLVN
jgi:hypothetical protein